MTTEATDDAWRDAAGDQAWTRDELDEWEAPAEIEAAFRTQRRIAVAYFLVFVVVTFTVPVLSLTWSWWTGASMIGGMSPSFLMAAVGLYICFLVIGVLAATLADSVEEHMLGSHDPSVDDRVLGSDEPWRDAP